MLAEAAPGNLAVGVKYRIAHRRYRLPFRQPVRTAHGLWTEREGFLLRLEDEQRRAGFGDIAPIPWFGTETVEDALDALESLSAEVPSANLLSLPSKLFALRSGVQTALTNLYQSGAGASAFETKAFPVAGLLPAGAQAITVVAQKAEVGFRTFKWKVGVTDLEDELAMLDDLVAALPNGGKLRLDANGAWDRRKAERWLERCAERPVEFVEQPCLAAPGDTAEAKARADDTLLGLAGDYPTPLALDESVISAEDIEAWLDRGWTGFFVLKPSLLGDPAAAVASLEKAKAPVVFSSALETAIGMKAALRLAFGFSGERRALGFGVCPLFGDGRFDGLSGSAFIRQQDVQSINEEELWNALS